MGNAPRWLLATAAAAALTGAAARLTALDRKPLWYDELATVRACLGHGRQEFINRLFAPPVRAGDLAARFWGAPRNSLVRTIAVLAREDQNHTPPFYLVTRLWMDAFGWSAGSARAPAAILGILCIGAAYAAGLVLQGRRTALVLAILVAASPVHLVYAQEAREYSLWAGVLFLWTTAFARALERGGWREWCVYAVAAGAAAYAHPVSVIVGFGHLGGVMAARRDRLPGLVAAGAAAAAIFSPWIWVYVANIANGGSIVKWTEVPLSLSGHFGSVVNTLSRPFVDPPPGTQARAAAGLVAAIAVVGAALGFRRLEKSGRVAAGAALLAVSVVFFGADIVAGGRRSAVMRFQFPTVVGLQILVAAALAGLTNRRLAAALTVVLALGFGSGLLYLRADTWWSKGRSADDAAVARSLADAGTVATTLPPITNPYYLVSLAGRLPRDVPVSLIRKGDPLPASPRPLYIVTPGTWAGSGLSALKARPVPAARPLWRID